MDPNNQPFNQLNPTPTPPAEQPSTPQFGQPQQPASPMPQADPQPAPSPMQQPAPMGQPEPMMQQPDQMQPPAASNPMAPQAPAGEDPGKTLAIVGIVLAFIFTIGGLIVSIIAKKKSQEAGFDGKLAKIGIILNATFMVLGLLLAIAMVVLGGMAAQQAAPSTGSDTFDSSVIEEAEDF